MNLRDRLRAVNGDTARAVKPAEAPGATDCMYRREDRPMADFPHAFEADRETLALMLGGLTEDFDPRRVLYLDTETTGFSGTGTVAFLVGLGFLTDTGFQVHQFLMRDYPEEPFLLKHVQNALNRYDWLCTFNGKSFDVPLLRDRFLMNRMDPACLEIPHIDLLHLARRIWKLRLGQCNLGRLEEVILDRPRSDDLPGSEVPARFFAYLKNKDMRLLEPVLTHNAQDIATLCTLLSGMQHLYRHPEEIPFEQDLVSMAGALEKNRQPEAARKVWRLAASSRGAMRAEAGLCLARNYRRQGERAEAVAIWRQMAERREGGIRPLIELAKYEEHVRKDIPVALDLTRKARILLAEPALSENKAVQDEIFAVEYRYARLKRKAAAQKGESKEWDFSGSKDL